MSVDLLRVWERRYGLLAPQRTPGGFRLYGDADRERVARMTARLADGFPASVAAQLALAADSAPGIDAATPAPHAMVADLRAALAAFDEAAANVVFDRALAGYSLETVLGEIVMPYLQELGRLWEVGEISIAQEHFATSIVRGRLLGIARGWGAGGGPTALLACPPGEQHDLGLIVFGLILRTEGWRIFLLGPNTPIATLAEAADNVPAGPHRRRVDASAPRHGRAGRDRRPRRPPPCRTRRPGATAATADRTGASLVTASPIDGARAVAASIAAERLPSRVS